MEKGRLGHDRQDGPSWKIWFAVYELNQLKHPLVCICWMSVCNLTNLLAGKDLKTDDTEKRYFAWSERRFSVKLKLSLINLFWMEWKIIQILI